MTLGIFAVVSHLVAVETGVSVIPAIVIAAFTALITGKVLL